MNALVNRRCRPCEGGVPPLDAAEARRLHAELDAGWELDDDAKRLSRRFAFHGFNRALGFANAVAWVAQVEGHHPELRVGWGYCEVEWTTHAIAGLSENDFICAAKTDALFDD